MNGFWDADFLLHPTNPSKLVNAKDKVFLSNDYGENWTVVDPGMPTNGLLIDMEQGVSNPDWLYVTNRTAVKVTSNLYDANPAWTDITAGLPLSNSVKVEQMTTNPSNPGHVWVGLTGYTPGEKVYFSTDGGATWQNGSGNLPNLPVNAIAYHPGSAAGIYVGTDIGVFYRDVNMPDWIYFNNGLPNVRISEFDVDGSYVYAATFGRGIWRSDHYTSCPVAVSLTPSNDPGSPTNTGVQRYSASHSIASTRIIQGGVGTDVVYNAGNFVRLDPGFEVRAHSLFVAKPGGCPDQ
jgi:hypothetical protein